MRGDVRHRISSQLESVGGGIAQRKKELPLSGPWSYNEAGEDRFIIYGTWYRICFLSWFSFMVIIKNKKKGMELFKISLKHQYSYCHSALKM